jgi:hypothetical protein
MKYGIINNEKFEVNTLIYDGTMYEEVGVIENIEDFLNENQMKSEKIYLYDKNVNVPYEELNINNDKYDITYINKNDLMISETDFNIIQLTMRLEELQNKNIIDEGYLNIFNQKDRKVIR